MKLIKKIVFISSLAVGNLSAATIIASSDTHIDAGNGDRDLSYQGESLLRVKDSGGSGTNTRVVYIKFDLSSIVGSVTSTSLNLKVGNVNGADYSLQLSAPTVLSASFNDTGVTWNNAPFNNTSTGEPQDSNILSTLAFSPALNEVISFTGSSIDQYINQELSSGNSEAIFVLRRTDTNGSSNLRFHSREAGTVGNRPSLTFIPEPSSAVLLGLGGLGFLLRRKRK